MTPFTVTIDGRPVEANPGETILTVARRIGMDIPALCFLERCGPLTSCLVCIVRVNGQDRLVPSCGTQVQPGMVIESESDSVRAARRTALELLLSDHLGDCLSPCNRICPLGLDIPKMIREIQAQRLGDAIATVRQSIALPAATSRLCHHPCEQGCRRSACDQSAAIRDLEQFVIDSNYREATPFVPPRGKPTGKTVAIVGAGPAGLTAAYHLLRAGHACTVFDRNPEPGGTLRSPEASAALPAEVLAREIDVLARLGAQFKSQVALGQETTLPNLREQHDAVLLAVGETSRADLGAWGLDTTGSGIKIEHRTYRTNIPGVFACGSAVKLIKPLVRAMSDGQESAACIDRFLNGIPVAAHAKPFSSVMGRLEKHEVQIFLRTASERPRVSPARGSQPGFTPQEAVQESGRCLHCDCRALGNCKLQQYAAAYGANAHRFPHQKKEFEQQRQPGGVLFEPGKCILCGICVRLAQQAAEPLGLTFVGRGFDVRVSAPFNHTITEGLQKVARECVIHCPTGALSFEHEPKVPGCGLPESRPTFVTQDSPRPPTGQLA